MLFLHLYCFIIIVVILWHYLRRLPVAFGRFLEQFCLKLKQNLMQILCSLKSVISDVKEIAGLLKYILTKTH
jgi:hypothetical protein